MTRFSRALAVAGITGALTVGAAGVAQASPDHGVRSSLDRASKLERVDRSRHDGTSRDRSRHDSKSGNRR